MKPGKTKTLTVVLISTLLSYTFGIADAAEDVASYYKGKTVTLTVGSSPAGGYDTWARTFGPALAKVIGATVVVKNIPEAGGVVALDDIYHSTNARGLKIHLAREILPALC